VGRACTLQATYASSSNIKTPSSAEALGEVNQDLHNGRVHVSSVTPIDFLLLSPFLFFLLAKYKSVFSFDFYIQFCFHSFVWYLFFFSFIFF
jgi:hypothetical protein